MEQLGFLPNLQLMSIAYVVMEESTPGFALNEAKAYRDPVYPDRQEIVIEFVNEYYLRRFRIDYTGTITETLEERND